MPIHLLQDHLKRRVIMVIAVATVTVTVVVVAVVEEQVDGKAGVVVIKDRNTSFAYLKTWPK